MTLPLSYSRISILDLRFPIPSLPPPQTGCPDPTVRAPTLNPKSKIENPKSAGGQGRVRTSVDRKGRQIYSLLLLTAQPPVRFGFFTGTATRAGARFRLAPEIEFI